MLAAQYPGMATAIAPPMTNMSDGSKDGCARDRNPDTFPTRRMPETVTPTPKTSPAMPSAMFASTPFASVFLSPSDFLDWPWAVAPVNTQIPQKTATAAAAIEK